jgi:hypothetical protein
VIEGPRELANILTTLMNPMTAVRSLGNTTAARKAERGAESMDCVEARMRRRAALGRRVVGNGMNDKQMADGRWVNTIVWKVLVSVTCIFRHHGTLGDPAEHQTSVHFISE